MGSSARPTDRSRARCSSVPTGWPKWKCDSEPLPSGADQIDEAPPGNPGDKTALVGRHAIVHHLLRKLLRVWLPYSCGLRRTADAVVVNLRNSVHCWIVLRSVAFLTFGFAAHSWVQFSDVSSPPGRAAAVRDTSRIDLKQDWRIYSSAKLRQAGEEISKTGFDTNGWYPSSVPSTVLNALVQNKVYPDPYFGMNLRQLPGIA